MHAYSRRRFLRTVSLGFAGLAGSLLATACGQPNAATQSNNTPTATTTYISPGQLTYPTPRPQDPIRVESQGIHIADPKFHTQLSSTVVVATVIQTYPARWTTSDGTRPANPHRSTNTIITPVEIQIKEVLKGNQVPERCILALPGGSIGADSINYHSDVNNLAPIGLLNVLWMNRWPGTPTQIDGLTVWGISETYRVTSNGIAENALSTMPYQELLNQIRSVFPATPTTRP